MIDKLLLKLTYDRPLKIISEEGRPYLERHYLGQLFGYIFYIHRFVGSDPDRGLHDHPWRRAFSIVLSGYYWEETRYGRHRVGWFNSLSGDSFHRVVLPQATYRGVILKSHRLCWTLFFHTKADVKRWGFLRDINTVKSVLYRPNQAAPKGVMIFEPYESTRVLDEPEWWERPDCLTRRKLEALL